MACSRRLGGLLKSPFGILSVMVGAFERRSWRPAKSPFGILANNLKPLEQGF